MQRYFVQIDKGKVTFTDDDIFHISRVMRLKQGELIEVVDQNHQLFIAEITTVKPFKADIKQILEANTELRSHITLYYVISKGEKTDLVIQKATELGVKSIVLLHSKRSVVKFEKDKYESKIQRYVKIAKEAAEQSRRLMIPSISIEAELSAIKSDRASLKIIADEDDAGTTEKLYNLLDKTQISDPLSLLVGSEGGFERSEVAMANACGFISIGLGKRILRSETAAIHLVGVVASYLERK